MLKTAGLNTQKLTVSKGHSTIFIHGVQRDIVLYSTACENSCETSSMALKGE